MSDAENDVEVRRSSRSRQNNKSQTRKSAIELLKESRKSGKAHRPDLDDRDIYDTVTEEEFDDIRRQRRADDFVVDDDGGGYVDDGEDIFDEDGEELGNEPPSKRKKKNDKKEPSKKGTINSFLTSTKVSARAKIKDESQVKLDDTDDQLNNMLAQLDDSYLDLDIDIHQSTPRSMNRGISNNPFVRGETERSVTEAVITPRSIKRKIPIRNVRQNKIELERTTPHSSTVAEHPKSEPLKCEDDNEFGAADSFEDIDYPVPVDDHIEHDDKEVVSSKSPAQLIADSDDKVAVKRLAEANWESEQNDDDSVKVEVVAGKEEFYVQQDDHTILRLYWLDAYEDSVKHNGTVYLFGRVLTGAGRSASCCVVVKNIHRQVYFLPRQTHVVNGVETPVLLQDVHAEIKDVLLQQAGVSTFRSKRATKKFMNDGTVDPVSVGDDVEVMEVQYDSASPRLSLDLSGKTFSAVYNTTTTAMERLLVEQEMMGPGWIDISNFVEESAKQSFCEYEFTVDMERMKNISYNTAESRPAPFARMLALNVITSLNNGKDNEICMISLLYNHRCNISNPSVDQKFLQRTCLVTKPSGGAALPFDLRDKLRVHRDTKLGEIVQTVANEKALISLFLAKLQKLEPDVLVGHDIDGTMELLKTRMQKLSIQNWSRTSRLKRSANLNTVKNNKNGQWELTAGRLLVDSKLSAMELVRSRSYDLSELAAQLLNYSRQNVYSNEVATMFGQSFSLINLIEWSFTDPWLALRIVSHLNALPLALQITNIVGGVTSRTLMGGRSERNEFLMLHAFHKGNIIAPNKYQHVFMKKGATQKKEAGDQNGEVPDSTEADQTMSKNNKAQYAGGLVLEPKKGLYDTLILLLDFNSLYPSIIQEYNICFTTVHHTKDGNDMVDIPSSGLSEGVLPREIRGLVERRRQVKTLMKSKEITAAKRTQYDIRQTALKLTANSMYGCLGFQQSRFYAKPLAALVTSKGREILMHTKDLVEKMGYTVVYGDTDSIMINTNSTDLQQAKKLGTEIKKQVNQCHRLLELDLDGVFKRMLLLKKKKYAALTVNVDNENDTKKELKGLDIVRRDWSRVAKEAGNAIVDLILDPELSREELVHQITVSLNKLRERLDAGKMETERFEISKQLTRNPKEYRDLKSQSHAAVAARLNDSGKFTLKQGDIVEYIICEDGSSNSSAQRAYHRTELESNPQLKIDLNYYLGQQIHPVVSRLCAPIEETDSVRIAEALGMDGTSYRRAAAAHASDEQSQDDELAWQGPLSFDHCDGLSFLCPSKCGNTIHIRSAIEKQDSVDRITLESCDKCGCSLDRYRAYILNQLDNRISEYVAKQLSCPFICDDTLCGNKIFSHPFGFNREGLKCSKCEGGLLKKEYSTKDLFDQQTFLRSILDLPSAVAQLSSMEQRRLIESRPSFPAMRTLAEEMISVVDGYLTKNAYNKVELSFLFAPMLKF